MTSMRMAAVAVGAAAILSACSSENGLQAWIKDKTGGGNEYRVVRNQPLVIPPGFDLRPPRGGGSELRQAGATTIQARRTVLGSAMPSGASPAREGAAERALVRRARGGVTASGSYVRKEVDTDTTQQKGAEQKFTDKLLKWEKRAGADTRKAPIGGKNDPVIKREGEIF